MRKRLSDSVGDRHTEWGGGPGMPNNVKPNRRKAQTNVDYDAMQMRREGLAEEWGLPRGRPLK